MQPRVTSKILLGSGSWFDFSDPDGSNVLIEDIAYGLAFLARFAGQTVSTLSGRRVYYSVAEHCVRMSGIVPPRLAMHALMHEAGEAVCGDMPTSLKALCLDFKEIEKRCEAAIMRKFGIDSFEDKIIKHFDHVMLVTERRDLMPWDGTGWDMADGIVPLPERIIPWSPNDAAERFLKRYAELRDLSKFSGAPSGGGF